MVSTIFLVFSLAWFVFFSYIFISFLFNMVLPLLFWGAFYIESNDNQIEKMIEFAKIKRGEKAVDLGAGDGKIIIALAKQNVESHGYEINPILVWKARQKITKAKVKNKAYMHWGNFWNKNIADFDAIFLYNISFNMRELEEKIIKEAKPSARIISNQFPFPTLEPVKQEKNIYLYQKTS